MATDFIMPRIPDYQSHHQSFYRPNVTRTRTSPNAPFQSQNYQQISPLSTSNSTGSNPQSPKAHYGRQVRPLYVPAVLRPNEHPSKPIRGDSRLDSSSISGTDSTGTSPVRPNSSYLGLAGLGALNRLKRRNTDEDRRSVEDDELSSWNLEVFPVVTDMPTRKHWKPDCESTICDEPTCKRYFGYFTRRHHCRRCGDIFCDLHSSYEVPLDQNAEFNPRVSVPSRSCSHCYSEYNVWRTRTNSQVSSAASSEANLQTLTGHGGGGTGHQRSQSYHVISSSSSSPLISSPAAINTPNPLNDNNSKNISDTAASVPRDWNWSTF